MALIVGVAVYSQVNEAERIKASLPKARVVVATQDIPPRVEISASMINVRTVPDELVQVGAATKIEDVVGKFTPDALLKGEVINTKRIGPVAAKNAPSFKIDKGKVMYVLPVSFGGTPFGLTRVNALRPGDRVDLFYTTVNVPQGLSPEQLQAVQANPVPYLQTRVMLQDLRIQEIGSYAPDGTLISSVDSGVVATSNIILIVSPEEALVLKWLKDAATFYQKSPIGGLTEPVEMVLRSPADEEKVDTNLLINFQYMREKYNLAPPPPSLTPGR